MTHAVTYEIPIADDEQRSAAEAVGTEPIPGRLSALAVRLPSGGLRITEVWESAEAGERGAAGGAAHEELPVVAFSVPTFASFTVYRNAPLRADPFVMRPAAPLETRPDDNIVEWIGIHGAPLVRFAWFQCRAQRIDSKNGDRAIWNDHWLYTVGPAGKQGWISMVDVKEGGDGEALPSFRVDEFSHQPGRWAPF